MASQYILQIETATQVCAVALSENGVTMEYRELDEPNVHASQLTLLISDVLQACGLSFTDLAAVAVSKGPGSYTGLRIGVSTAKGLCYATGLPLIALDTLRGMAEGFVALQEENIDADTRLCPMVDARRMEVYSAIFDHRLHCIAPPSANIIDEHSFNGITGSERIILFGSGADKFEQLFVGKAHVQVVPGFKNSARHMSRFAYETFLQGKFQDVAYFEPYYLKDFVATVPKK